MDRSATSPAPWSAAQRIAFRFLFCYLVLFIFPAPLNQFLNDDSILGYDRIWKAVAPWVGAHILHLRRVWIPPPDWGGGDTSYEFVQLFCFFCVAAIATLAWSVADRRRQDYRRLLAWLRVYVRYVLAITLLAYGMSKVFKAQFPDLSLGQLLQPFGSSSPMGLLWKFMGYSAPYTIFAGASEVLGAILLFFKRTTTLGALILTGVLCNVVMLNFSYDVPVKLFSLHLLFMAVFLWAADGRRLLDVLVLNRPAAPADLGAPPGARWQRIGSRVLKAAVIGVALFTTTRQGLVSYRMQHGRNTVPLRGIYDVEEFVRNGVAVPPLATDATRWKRFIVNDRGMISILGMDESSKRLRFKFSPDDTAVTLFDAAAPAKKYVLACARPDKEHLVLDGSYMDQRLNVRLRRFDESQFLLVNRGFHLVSDDATNQ